MEKRSGHMAKELFQKVPLMKAAADRAASEDAKKKAGSRKGESNTRKASHNGEEDEKITFMTMCSPPSDSEPTCKISRNLVVSTQDQNVSNKLAESFIIDSGATIHVCNDFDPP